MLRGWTLSTVSLYLPDLVVYGAVVAAIGLGSAAVHVANALLYTLVLVAAAGLAAGRGENRLKALRAVLTVAILLSPTPGLGAHLLLLAGAHVGTTLLVLVAFLLLDRAEDRPVAIAAVGAILLVAAFSDPLSWLVGALPIAGVYGLSLFLRDRNPVRDLGLVIPALLALPVANWMVFQVHRRGGYETYPLVTHLASPSVVVPHAKLAWTGVLALFGAGGDPVSAVHVAGLLFTLIALGALPVMAFRRQPIDRTALILAAGMVLDLSGFLFTTAPEDVQTTRYLIPLFIFGAVLAGRVGGSWLDTTRRRPAAVAAALLFAATLAVNLYGVHVAPPDPVAAFLADRQLRTGFGAYWEASATTVQSGGRVAVRPILSDGQRASGYAWESKRDWYAPRAVADARFVVYDTATRQPFGVSEETMTAVFGPPSEVHRFGGVVVLVWDQPIGPRLAS